MHNNISRYKTALFDCDGVILDSNQVKTNAFKKVLKDYPSQLVCNFIEYHKQHGGISRYQKFSYFFKEVLQIANHSAQIEKALTEFRLICIQDLVSCSEIAGVRNVLYHFNKYSIPCYVISGGDEDEIKTIFEKRGLSSFFTGIFGSPKTKEEHLKNLLKDGLLHQPSIFFGDSKLDYEVSKRFNCDFAFIYGASEWNDGLSIAEQSNFFHYRDFTFFNSQIY